MSDEMTGKMEFFCREYLVDFNATQAAIRAGYSPEAASSIGYENLNKPQIQKRIAALKEERAAVAEVTAERVIRELARIAFTDTTAITAFIRGKTKTGRRSKKGSVQIASFDELTPDQRASIVGVVETKGASPKIEVKFHDKTKALEMLAKYTNIFKSDDISPSVTVINLTPNFGEKKLEPPKADAVAPGKNEEGNPNAE